jgi:hypothetical protein
VTKGQEIWTRNSEGALARFKVTGTTEHGVNGVWLDGPLKDKEAAIEKQTLSEIAAAAKRGATARRRSDEDEDDMADAALPDAPAEARAMLDQAIGLTPEVIAQGEAEAAAADEAPDPEPFPCPDSACRQNWIDTGETECVAEALDADREKLEAIVAESEETARKEAVKAAARERVRKWRAAKKAAVQS